eukprot:TRINITY_DN76658_c0_g1_i1.p2 TRINITY_DN76658_c0_g1~~TRINITY_DN76658_c0_g1_i1.p2  ORF type:complete len:334 (+),score=45.92 TRINITY_DN76658_c0_g1_i1:60-1061(+)
MACSRLLNLRWLRTAPQPTARHRHLAILQLARPSGSTSVPVDAAEKLGSLPAVLAGGAAGVILSVAGIGGGAAIIPVLKRLTSLTQFQINATLLAALASAGAIGAADFWNHGCADLQAAAMLFTFAVPMTPLGIRVGRMMPDKSLTRLMGLACLCAVPLCAADAKVRPKQVPRPGKEGTSVDSTFIDIEPRVTMASGSHATDIRNSADAVSFVTSHREYALIGASSGFITGALSMGGGWVQMLGLSAFSPLSQPAVIGTSLCASIPTNLLVTAQNLMGGQVHVRTALLLGLGASLGITAGANMITYRVDEHLLRFGFCGVLILASFDILRKAR